MRFVISPAVNMDSWMTEQLKVVLWFFFFPPPCIIHTSCPLPALIIPWHVLMTSHGYWLQVPRPPATVINSVNKWIMTGRLAGSHHWPWVLLEWPFFGLTRKKKKRKKKNLFGIIAGSTLGMIACLLLGGGGDGSMSITHREEVVVVVGGGAVGTTSVV